MPNGTIVAAWQDATQAHMAVRVAEPDTEGARPVEYIGSVPLAELAGKTAAQKKAILAAAVKAARDAQPSAGPTDLGLSGTVTL